MAAAPPGWRQNPDGSWWYQAGDGNWYPQQAPPPPVVVVAPYSPLRGRTSSTFLSFVGVTRRASAWLRGSQGHGLVRFLILWPLVGMYLFLMYALIIFWYACVVVPFFFLVIPWRVLRRGQRQRKHLQDAQLATLQQIAQQQPPRQ